MEFTNRKLPVTAAPSLRQLPIAEVKPYSLMLAPAYVFLKRNERFVAVKAPLDFFLPEEIERMRALQTVFMPASVLDAVEPFRAAARRVRTLLAWQPLLDEKPGAGSLSLESEVGMPPPPYAVSDAVLRVIGPLWSKPARIEPYFVSVFADQLCDALPAEALKEARERSVELFERALFRSSLAVFLALHLGYMDLPFLSWLRRHAFVEVARGVNHRGEAYEATGEIGELLSVVALSVAGPETRVIDGEALGRLEGKVAQKLETRIERVTRELVDPRGRAPTIFGPEGILVA